MCRCGYYSREGLLRNRAEIGHGEAEDAEAGVEFVEGDSGFGHDNAFFSVDLFEGDGNGRLPLAVVPERDTKCERWCISHHPVMDDGHKRERVEEDGRGWGNLIRKRTYMEDLIQFGRSQHVLICANQVAGAVADARGSDRLALSSGKLKY